VTRQIEVHSRPSTVEHWRHVAEIVALLIAAIWAAYIFVYQERIKPAEAPLQLESTVSVDHNTIAGGKEFVKVNFAMKNIGEEPFALDGLVVNVYGIRFSKMSGEYVEKPLNGVIQLSRTLLPSKPRLLYSYFDTWHGFGSPKVSRISPEITFDESFAFAVPSEAFDVAKIEWLVCWSPMGTKWPVKRERQADGSYWISGWDTDSVLRAGLICRRQLRGDYYPL